MTADSRLGVTDPPKDQNQSGTKDIGRREALGRLAAYTAPAMMALLLSEPAAAQTAPSDIRLKRDIAQVGRLPNGLGLYRYRYLWSDETYVGVMAQEVEAIAPDAVVRAPDGHLRVDYANLGLRLRTWDQWAAAT